MNPMALNRNDTRENISLYSYGKSIGDIKRLRDEILGGMSSQLFRIDNWNTFAFVALSQLVEMQTLEDNELAINDAASKVLSHFDINEQDYSSFLENDKSLPELKNWPATKTFVNFILFLEKLPSHTYQLLESKVKEHLISITSLIEWYEADSYVQELIVEEKKPSDHEESIKHDFYKRCLAEQKVILKYFLFGLIERALHKSMVVPLGLGPTLSFTERFRDYPYKFGHFASDVCFFDCRLIDEVGHRLAEIPVSKGRELEKLYSTDKETFYLKLFSFNAPQQLFQNIDFHLAHVPLQKDRKPIFIELKALFDAEQWMAFHALALPQVEGLFTDMVDLVRPEKKTQSLPVKVETIRPFHNLSEAYFDYYQYHIPRLRNNFMHTGYGVDFKMRSYDLLTDLDHLLRTFYELDNASVKLKRLHVRRDPEEFVSYSEFAQYFSLIERLDSNKKKEFSKDTETFEREFLNVSCDVQIVSVEATQDLPQVIKKIIEILEFHLQTTILPSQLNTMNPNEFKLKLKDEKLVARFRKAFEAHEREFEDLKCLDIFLNNFEKHLPSLDEKVKILLKKEKSDNSKFFSNIQLARRLAFETPH